jgi:hypothetical protein
VKKNGINSRRNFPLLLVGYIRQPEAEEEEERRRRGGGIIVAVIIVLRQFDFEFVKLWKPRSL